MERSQGGIASPRTAGMSSRKSSLTKGPLLGTTIKYKKYDEHGASDIGIQVNRPSVTLHRNAHAHFSVMLLLKLIASALGFGKPHLSGHCSGGALA